MLTQKRLKVVLKYYPETGLFERKIKTSNRAVMGRTKGHSECSGDRYAISIDNVTYKCHRLAWLYCYGYTPENEIDHKNGDSKDNRIKNLREVSHMCNLQNCKISINNTSGFNGVTWNKHNKNWRSQIFISGVKIDLGSHVDKISAALARIMAEDCIEEWKCNYRSENRNKLRRYGYHV